MKTTISNISPLTGIATADSSTALILATTAWWLSLAALGCLFRTILKSSTLLSLIPKLSHSKEVRWDPKVSMTPIVIVAFQKSAWMLLLSSDRASTLTIMTQALSWCTWDLWLPFKAHTPSTTSPLDTSKDPTRMYKNSILSNYRITQEESSSSILTPSL